MATWEEFKKKMFKKNKNFERDFKEIERRIEMEKYFENLKKFKNSLSEAGLPADVENEILKTYAIEAVKKLVNKEEKDETISELKELAKVFK